MIGSKLELDQRDMEKLKVMAKQMCSGRVFLSFFCDFQYKNAFFRAF